MALNETLFIDCYVTGALSKVYSGRPPEMPVIRSLSPNPRSPKPLKLTAHRLSE